MPRDVVNGVLLQYSARTPVALLGKTSTFSKAASKQLRAKMKLVATHEANCVKLLETADKKNGAPDDRLDAVREVMKGLVGQITDGKALGKVIKGALETDNAFNNANIEIPKTSAKEDASKTANTRPMRPIRRLGSSSGVGCTKSQHQRLIERGGDNL